MHGDIEKLGKVTFFDTLINHKNVRMTDEGALEKWVADSKTFLVGENVADEGAIKFNCVTFSIEGLYEWTGRITGLQSFGTTNNPTYTQPLDLRFELGATDKLLGIQIRMDRNRSDLPRSELKLVESMVLSLSKRDDKSPYGDLEEAMEDIYSLRDLLSLLIGHRVGVEDIRLYDSDNGFEYQYFIRGAITKKGEEERKRRLVFTELKNISWDEFEGILEKWVGLKKGNDYILREFLNTQSRGGVAANFLSYARFLEAFHRNICATKPFDDELELIERVNAQIKDLVKREAPRAESRYLDSLISINSYTFQEKLVFLFDKFLPDDIKTELDITPGFATQVKKMRNELTHLGKGVSKMNRQDLLDMSEKLKVVAYVIIFKSIGLTDELLSKKLQWVA